MDVIKTYWQVLENFRRRSILIIFLIGVSGLLEGSALVVLVPILKSEMSEDADLNKYYQIMGHMGISPDQYQLFGFLSFIFLGILAATIKLWSDTFHLKLKVELEKSIRQKMTDSLLRIKWSKFLSLGLGDISKATLLESFHIIQGVQSFHGALGGLIISLSFIVVAFFISIEMTLYTLVFGALAGIGYTIVNKKAFVFAQKLSHSGTLIGKEVNEIFGNLKLLKATGFSAQAENKTNEIFSRFKKTSYKSQIYGHIIRFVFGLTSIIFLGGILGYSLLYSRQSMAEVVILLAIFLRLSPRIRGVHDGFYSAKISQPWYETWKKRYEFILENFEENTGRKTPEFNRNLSVRDIFFHYTKAGKNVLEDLSFSLNKGNCMAVVGPSGSGKSTLIDLITGLLKPSGGSVMLDEVSLADIDLELWRKKIGLVLQESPMFHSSILENIAWGYLQPDIAKAEHCAKLAHAWEFISKLPEGLNSIVGERGGRLSGGQKQRIALARALYRDPWLLILDEATSALDGESEIIIQNALESLKGKLTIFIVAHRIKTVQMADKILVLNEGRVVEKGSWQELIELPEGKFRRMAQLQGLIEQPSETRVR